MGKSSPRSSPQTLLEEANGRLKASKTRLQIEIRRRSLFIRGTFPNRGSDGRSQQRIPLGLQFTPWGIKQAEIRALELWTQLCQGTFKWSDWGKLPYESCGEVVARFRREVFWNKSESQWKDFLNTGIRLLEPEQPFCASTALSVVENIPEDSWLRLRAVQSITRLMRFAGLPGSEIAAIKALKGTYQYGSVRERQIPTDSEILEARQQIKNPGWLKVFDLMAIYGLRNHECWYGDSVWGTT